MKLMLIGLAGASAAAALAGSAVAREAYANLFFVRPEATARAFFHDRSGCRNEAVHMGDNAAAYTNPEYGALSAMGSALDEDALHEDGLHERMRQAVFTDCMKRLGWTPAEPTEAETRELMKASLRHPEALDAWLKAHEPPPAPAVAADRPAAPAAAQTVKTAAATPPATPPKPAPPTVKAAN